MPIPVPVADQAAALRADALRDITAAFLLAGATGVGARAVLGSDYLFGPARPSGAAGRRDILPNQVRVPIPVYARKREKEQAERQALPKLASNIPMLAGAGGAMAGTLLAGLAAQNGIGVSPNSQLGSYFSPFPAAPEPGNLSSLGNALAATGVGAVGSGMGGHALSADGYGALGAGLGAAGGMVGGQLGGIPGMMAGSVLGGLSTHLLPDGDGEEKSAQLGATSAPAAPAPDKGLLTSFFANNESADSVSGIPWYGGAMAAAGLGGLFGGYQLADNYLDKKRKADLEAEIARAREEYRKAMLDSYDPAQVPMKTAAEQPSRVLDDVAFECGLDDTLTVKEADTLGDLLGKAFSGYGMAAVPAGMLAALAAYRYGRSRSTDKLLDEALKQRERDRLNRRPPEVVAVPEPVAVSRGNHLLPV